MNKRSWFCIVIFVFCFGPVVRSPLGPLGDVSLFFIFIFLAWSICRLEEVQEYVFALFLITLAISSIALFNTIIKQEYFDFYSILAILRPLKAGLVVVGLYFFLKKYSYLALNGNCAREKYEDLLKLVYIIIVVHGIIIIAQFIFPSFREFSYTVLRDMGVLEYNKRFRMPGLAGAGGAQVSAVQGIGFLLGVHLASVRRRYLPYVLGNFVLVGSFILTGRTGFVLVGVSIIYWFVSVSLRFSALRLFSAGRAAVRLGFLVFCAIFLLVVGWIALASIYESNTDARLAIDRTFESYNSYMDTGRVSDRTLSVLSDMFVFPHGISENLFGEARQYDNTSGSYISDIGYIRIFWGYGLIGLVLHLCFYIFLSGLVFKKSVVRELGFQNILFLVVSLVSLFVLNFKEVFFFTRIMHQLFIVVFLGAFVLVACDSNKYKDDLINL